DPLTPAYQDVSRPGNNPCAFLLAHHLDGLLHRLGFPVGKAVHRLSSIVPGQHTIAWPSEVFPPLPRLCRRRAVRPFPPGRAAPCADTVAPEGRGKGPYCWG